MRAPISSLQRMSATSSSSTTPVKRACDSCHRRKVKCIGEGTNPCKNCLSAGLECTYHAVPQKKGPKGSRAKVLSELRETQRQSQFASTYQPNEFHYDRRAGLTQSTLRTPGLLTVETVTDCVEFFFAHLYPLQPILHRARVDDAIMKVDQSPESCCFVIAFCASVLIQSNMNLPTSVVMHGNAGVASNISYGQMLLDETMRIRRIYNHIEHPSTMSIATSFFLFNAYYTLDKQNAAWFYLREATTHAHMMNMHSEEAYRSADQIDSSRKRRLYWLLYISERVYAIQNNRPITLYPTINMPQVTDDPTDILTLTGFNHLITLYKPFDHAFISVLNKPQHACLPSFLANLQKQVLEALPAYLETTEIQAVDLRASQQWLRIMVWQLSISHSFVASMAQDASMSFNYPNESTRDIVSMAQSFNQQAMELHGLGMIEKLFDIACTLTDILSSVSFPHQQSPQHSSYALSSAQDYLARLVSLLGTVRTSQSRFLPSLLSKMHDSLPNANMSLPSHTTNHTNQNSNSHTHPHHTPTSHHASAVNIFDNNSTGPPVSTPNNDTATFDGTPSLPSTVSLAQSHDLAYVEMKSHAGLHEGLNAYAYAAGMEFPDGVSHGGPQPVEAGVGAGEGAGIFARGTTYGD